MRKLILLTLFLAGCSDSAGESLTSNEVMKAEVKSPTKPAAIDFESNCDPEAVLQYTALSIMCMDGRESELTGKCLKVGYPSVLQFGQDILGQTYLLVGEKGYDYPIKCVFKNKDALNDLSKKMTGSNDYVGNRVKLEWLLKNRTVIVRGMYGGLQTGSVVMNNAHVDWIDTQGAK